MAGRGTDILLGGNPKGLTAQALGNRLLPVLAGGERFCLGGWVGGGGGCVWGREEPQGRDPLAPVPTGPPPLQPPTPSLCLRAPNPPSAPSPRTRVLNFLRPAAAAAAAAAAAVAAAAAAASGAEDLDAWLPPVPLASLSTAFVSLRAMADRLPPLLAGALAAAELRLQAWMLQQQQQQQQQHQEEQGQRQEGGGAAGSGARRGGLQRGRARWGGPTGAAAAATWLSQVVEAAEVTKAHLDRQRWVGSVWVWAGGVGGSHGMQGACACA